MQKSGDQKNFFVRYLSLAPVLAVVATSLAFTIWAIFNNFFPDLLFHPLP